jgi:DNA recombination-mediator protein A
VTELLVTTSDNATIAEIWLESAANQTPPPLAGSQLAGRLSQPRRRNRLGSRTANDTALGSLPAIQRDDRLRPVRGDQAGSQLDGEPTVEHLPARPSSPERRPDALRTRGNSLIQKRFLIRNRIIAALSRGTVVVEAALRSGALSTARHARQLRRPLMAVPGPVTSEQSTGCHELIRERAAVCVTGARDVIEHVSPIGTEPAGPRRAARPPGPGDGSGPGSRPGARRPRARQRRRSRRRRPGHRAALPGPARGGRLHPAHRPGLAGQNGHVTRARP